MARARLPLPAQPVHDQRGRSRVDDTGRPPPVPARDRAGDGLVLPALAPAAFGPVQLPPPVLDPGGAGPVPARAARPPRRLRRRRPLHPVGRSAAAAPGRGLAAALGSGGERRLDGGVLRSARPEPRTRAGALPPTRG